MRARYVGTPTSKSHYIYPYHTTWDIKAPSPMNRKYFTVLPCSAGNASHLSLDSRQRHTCGSARLCVCRQYGHSKENHDAQKHYVPYVAVLVSALAEITCCVVAIRDFTKMNTFIRQASDRNKTDRQTDRIYTNVKH